MESFESWLSKKKRRAPRSPVEFDDNVSIASGTTVSIRGIGLSALIKRIEYLEEVIKKLALQVSHLASAMESLAITLPSGPIPSTNSSGYEIDSSQIYEAQP